MTKFITPNTSFLFFTLLLSFAGCEFNKVYIKMELADTINNSPTSVTSGLNQISVSPTHSCALYTTGAVKCWGNNDRGQLGNGATTNSSIPVNVVGLSSKVTQIATAYAHTCALINDGSVKCWGSNNSYQLGDGTTNNSLTPVTVVGLTSKAIQIVTNDESNGNYGWGCALLDTSIIQCWGGMPDGLGDGVNSSSATPITVLGSAGAKKIAIGSDHACFITSSNGVKCWGGGVGGKLGNGLSIASQTPVDVTGLSSGVADISVGSSGWDNDGFSCAVLKAGTVKCWGNNGYGQLGDGTMNSSAVPVDVLNITNAVSVYVAQSQGNLHGHACVLDSNKLLSCWGSNVNGVLGDGTTNDQLSPISINVFSGPISSFSNLGDGNNGGGHSCAMKSDDTINCWGLNWAGQLGNGTTSDRLTP